VLCAQELYAMDKGMEGMTGIQLCLERQLKSGVPYAGGPAECP